MQNQRQPSNKHEFPETMMNMVFNMCSILTLPIEMVLRPQYGSQYFSPLVTCLTSMVMMFIPLFSGIGFAHLLPFASPPSGLFGLGTISRLYFLGGFIHGFRIWRRMIHMELEVHSEFEGPPLPIFRILPGTFYVVRIIYEPLFVFLVALVLQNLFILQSAAVNYLILAAMALAMKNYISWFLEWRMLRIIIDMRNTGPIIAKFVENTATETDLATIHLASLPKNIPDDLRRETATFLSRAIIDRPLEEKSHGHEKEN
jgi:hypothetical protein